MCLSESSSTGMYHIYRKSQIGGQYFLNLSHSNSSVTALTIPTIHRYN